MVTKVQRQLRFNKVCVCIYTVLNLSKRCINAGAIAKKEQTSKLKFSELKAGDKL